VWRLKILTVYTAKKMKYVNTLSGISVEIENVKADGT
jgi:hypothetical protein